MAFDLFDLNKKTTHLCCSTFFPLVLFACNSDRFFLLCVFPLFFCDSLSLPKKNLPSRVSRRKTSFLFVFTENLLFRLLRLKTSFPRVSPKNFLPRCFAEKLPSHVFRRKTSFLRVSPKNFLPTFFHQKNFLPTRTHAVMFLVRA